MRACPDAMALLFPLLCPADSVHPGHAAAGGFLLPATQPGPDEDPAADAAAGCCQRQGAAKRTSGGSGERGCCHGSITCGRSEPRVRAWLWFSCGNAGCSRGSDTCGNDDGCSPRLWTLQGSSFGGNGSGGGGVGTVQHTAAGGDFGRQGQAQQGDGGVGLWRRGL